ncbi:hypothetical protein BSF41_30300 [Flavobacterium sp. ACN2]|jgi:hypothetical protein|uniref:hypothetical protein n=1 Tax=Flavobacterium sp. ACN2 TaxID=1975676 RepID=UPI000BB33EC6|nr:hypothetical protein [Flavobacterium sp. ACN2]PBI87593.1 hypothetical protein BSF41_30300 [Flavobacterium sp. ACN2]
MKLRKEIEPQLEVAEKLYSKILKSLIEYAEFCDENDDEENVEYQKLEEKLHILTRKDMTQFNLWEWWEEEGVEVLAFRIALPNPLEVENITKEELSEIICNRLQWSDDFDDDNFNGKFSLYLDNYYHDFLKLNFKRTYNYSKIFCTQKNKDKSIFELTNEEKVEKLWG